MLTASIKRAANKLNKKKIRNKLSFWGLEPPLYKEITKFYALNLTIKHTATASPLKEYVVCKKRESPKGISIFIT